MKTVLKQSQSVWVILSAVSFLTLALPAQAASFDCAKARMQVEKLICEDAELSRLDEDLAAAYASALKGGGNAVVRDVQKRWIKERNICGDVACLHASYSQRIALLKAQPMPDKSAKNAPLTNNATAPATKALAPFTFGPPLNNSMANQREVPVCRDFLNHLNRPRSNELFKPDGSLVHESETIKSVRWERLDKEEYREGFMTVVDAENANNIREGQLKRYADPEWILERTLARPLESRPKPDASEKWLYRLMQSRPYMRNWSDPGSKVELPTWFPFTSITWVGDSKGERHVADVHPHFGVGTTQWFEHGGKTHAVSNQTFGDGKGAKPKYLTLLIYALHVDTESHSIAYLTCALRARNAE